MIRPGTLEDAAQMAEIFNHYIRTSDVIFSNIELSAEMMRDRLAPVVGHFPFLVWEENGRVEGYCYAHLWHPDPVYGATWELTEYLRHGCVGHGIGSALLDGVTELCRIQGAHALVSCVTAGNTACERMLIKAGFIRTGVLREAGYKFGVYLDDVFYQKML